MVLSSSLERSLFRSSDNNDLSAVLKFLVDQTYQATASTTEKEKARKELELQFSSVLSLLEESSADNRLVTKAKALSSSLYNIYKEARQSSRSDIQCRKQVILMMETKCVSVNIPCCAMVAQLQTT